MELNKGNESGKMYSPDDQGEYVPKSGMQNFSVQGLSDALTSLESKVTMVQPPAEEYALLLEVTMADCPGCPCLPTFSWNLGMVLHILKDDPTLRDLEHVQVDGPVQCTSSFMISRATGDYNVTPLKLSKCMWWRCFLSGFPILLILLSFPSHWRRAGSGPWPLWIDATKGPEQSIQTTQCLT